MVLSNFLLWLWPLWTHLTSRGYVTSSNWGNLHLVYPMATHTRFQHSIGVAFLAQKFALELKSQKPDLVSDIDVICVMLAGLCHDLGHGAFSHLWETFVSRARPDDCWHHEDNSIQMFDRLIADNDLKPSLNKFGLNDVDILFIKEMISGPIDKNTGLPIRGFNPISSDAWPYSGRDEEKSFLYEIVANKISGIDVDKWDYFLRDDYNLKIGHIFNYERFIKYSKVLKTGNPRRNHICLRDKEAELLCEMFQDRARLHKNGYQHRVSMTIDEMMVLN